MRNLYIVLEEIRELIDSGNLSKSHNDNLMQLVGAFNEIEDVALELLDNIPTSYYEGAKGSGYAMSWAKAIYDSNKQKLKDISCVNA